MMSRRIPQEIFKRNPFAVALGKKHHPPKTHKKKRKKKQSFGRWVGAVLAGCVFCFGLLFLIHSFRMFLLKVASHGVDVVGESWLKYTCLRIFLTVLRLVGPRPLFQRNGHQRRSPCQKCGLASQNFLQRWTICDLPI